MSAISKNTLNMNRPASVLLTALALVAVCCANNERLQRSKVFVSFLHEMAFPEHDLFQATVRSGPECAMRCASKQCCLSFSYSSTSGASGACGGHSAVRNSTASATSFPGTKIYNAAGEENNVALRKATSQVSTLDAVNAGGVSAGAANAVDGNTTPDFFHGSCTHIAQPEEGAAPAWWQVDLGLSHCNSSVIICSREYDLVSDVQERLHDFDIHVYASDPESDPLATASLCHHQTGPIGSGTVRFPCTPSAPPGRFVRITNGGVETLTLCEVQVMAHVSP